MLTNDLRHLEELRHKRADALEEMQTLSKAPREGNLSAEETRRFTTLERTFDSLHEEIEALEEAGDFGPRITRAAIFGAASATDTRDGVALRSENRLEDWARARYDDGSRSDRPLVGDRDDFSLGRMVRGMATGHWGASDVERRALSEGTDTAGGFLTPEILGSQVIDRVRKRAKILEAGARIFPMESDKEYLPRLTGGVTPTWKAENAAISNSDPTFDRVTFSAKTLAVGVTLSYELFDDMTDQGAQVIENELVQAISLELDRAALRGSGTGQEPTGIRNQSGVTIQSLGANGASPTYAALVNAVAAVQAANLDPNAAIYSSRAAKTLTNLADTTGQPLQKPPLIADLPLLVSNQIPENLTQGSSSDASEIYTGQWDQLFIGIRPRVRISVQSTQGLQGGGQPAGFPVNTKASSEVLLPNLSVYVAAWIRADVQLLHPEGFVVTTGVRP